MEHHKASKVVIITEKIILGKVTQLIEAAGARGYTVTPAGGKGSRGVRSTSRANVIDELSNVKIEVIIGSREAANRIADEVAETFFDHYSGITYLEEVEILRPHKF
ncbi:MAG: P-II family nitrogen regulator [Wenzhouxiangella sp.]